MANTLVFTPNAACSNTIVLRGIIPGASYDHTWFVEDWDCTAGTLLGGGGAGSANANYESNGGFKLWFTDPQGVLLVTVDGESVVSETSGKIRFNMTGVQTELLRGQTVGRCGAGYVDSAVRNIPIETGRYHVEDWPAITWEAGS